MKKFRVYIAFCGLLLLLLQPGDVFSAKKTAHTRDNHVASAFIQFPHTELELHGGQWTNAAPGTFRIEGGHASLSHTELRIINTFSKQAIAHADADNLSFKNYLFHIYPSHNFW